MGLGPVEATAAVEAAAVPACQPAVWTACSRQGAPFQPSQAVDAPAPPPLVGCCCCCPPASPAFGEVKKRVRTTAGGSTGSVRNLRIREDTAKYLLNLDTNSAHYDPKSRSMREDPNPNKVLAGAALRQLRSLARFLVWRGRTLRCCVGAPPRSHAPTRLVSHGPYVLTCCAAACSREDLFWRQLCAHQWRVCGLAAAQPAQHDSSREGGHGARAGGCGALLACNRQVCSCS